MPRVHRTCALLILSLTLGCGGRSDSSVAPSTEGSAQPAAADSVPVPAPAPVPAEAARASVPPALGPQPEVPPTSQLPACDVGHPVAYKYNIQLDSACKAVGPDGQGDQIDANTALSYVWRWRGNEAELLLDGMKVLTKVNGEPVMDSSMSASHFYIKQGDRTMNETFDRADPQMKQVLHDCFQAPLCKVSVDPYGRELQRTVTAGPAAQSVVDTGIITNTRFFHAPFLPDQRRWEAPGEMATGDGGYARGTLTYQLTDRPVTSGDEPSNLVEVSVAGTLLGDATMKGGMVENAVYRIEGTQIYNQRLRQWICGALTVGATFQTQSAGQTVTHRGTIRLAMQLVGSEQLPPVRVADGERRNVLR